MKTLLNKIKRPLCRMNYLTYVKKCPIREEAVLLEAQHGTQINGNIYYILEELCVNPSYQDKELYLSVTHDKLLRINKILQQHPAFSQVSFVVRESLSYYKLLASAKYLITDNTFPAAFIKKDKQILLNTWHGTPLKTLGKQIANDMHSIGNTQKNFFHADYLLYPNKFTMEHMISDYMLENISCGQALLCGYPRNTAFFNKIKKSEETQIIAYMPTWRGTFGKVDDDIQQLYQLFHQLEQRLSGNQLLYVNLHPIVDNRIDFDEFKKIKPFPEDIETYAFLNTADCLITDYSSVMFDYALTRRKVILFVYDKEEYLKDRGVYLDIASLPFPNVMDIDSLMAEINTEVDYDIQPFLDQFCSFDSSESTKLLCERVIGGNENALKAIPITKEKNENVLITIKDLGDTDELQKAETLIEHYTKEGINVFFTFPSVSMTPKRIEGLQKLSKKADYLAPKGRINLTLFQEIKCRLFGKISKETLAYEKKRLYGNIIFKEECVAK